MGTGVVGRLDCENFVRQGCEIVAGASVADAVQVHMAVDQSGQDSLAFVDDLLDVRSLRGDDGLLRSDRRDSVAFEEDGASLQWGTARPVDETVGGEEGEVGGGSCHG